MNDTDYDDERHNPYAAPGSHDSASGHQAAMARCASHLDTLAILHYVYGGIGAFFSLFPVIYVVIGIAMLAGVIPMEELEPAVEDMNAVGMSVDFLGWMFVIIGGVFFLLGQILSWLVIYSGRCMKRRRRPTLSLVMAILNCLSIPLGTILGIFTIVVLMKEDTKAVYAQAEQKAD